LLAGHHAYFEKNRFPALLTNLKSFTVILIMRDKYKKAEALLRLNRVKLDMKGSDKIYFTVKGDHETYSVIIHTKNSRCTCTCRYWSVTQRKCSHILACLLYLKKLERVLKTR